MEYPACRNDTAKASPPFPAPTIAIRGFRAMPGRIAESGSSLRVPTPHQRPEAMLYIGFHAESRTLFFTPKKIWPQQDTTQGSYHFLASRLSTTSVLLSN